MDFSEHLTGTELTRFFSGVTLFDSTHADAEARTMLQQIARTLKNTRISLLRPEDAGLTPDMEDAELQRALCDHLDGINDPALMEQKPYFPAIANYLLDRQPAFFLDAKTGAGHVYFMTPSCKESLQHIAAIKTRLPQHLLTHATHVSAAEVNNLLLLMSLHRGFSDIAITLSGGLLEKPASQSQALAASYAWAVEQFERNGGNPAVSETMEAMRMVSCFTQSTVPNEILGYLCDPGFLDESVRPDASALAEIFSVTRLNIFLCGQDDLPEGKAAMQKLVDDYENDVADLTPPVLARGLRETLEEMLQCGENDGNKGVYVSPRALMTDYAAFNAFMKNPAHAGQATRDFLNRLDKDKLTYLALFHVVGGALSGLKLLTGEKFASLIPGRNTDALLQRILFATAPQNGAKPS